MCNLSHLVFFAQQNLSSASFFNFVCATTKRPSSSPPLRSLSNNPDTPFLPLPLLFLTYRLVSHRQVRRWLHLRFSFQFFFSIDSLAAELASFGLFPSSPMGLSLKKGSEIYTYNYLGLYTQGACNHTFEQNSLKVRNSAPAKCVSARVSSLEYFFFFCSSAADEPECIVGTVFTGAKCVRLPGIVYTASA